MRLTTFVAEGKTMAGVLLGEHVVKLGTTLRGAGLDGALGATVRTYLAHHDAHGRIVEAAAELVARDEAIPVESVRLLAPVPDPDKILCVGLNYRDHAEEAGLALPTEPLVFAKFRNSLVGHADPVEVPKLDDSIDYEVELAIVIGKPGRQIRIEDALDHVVGAMTFNDLTARQMQHATSQWTMGKAIDGFAPCGPSLVTLDEVGALDDLTLRTTVNGVVVQDGTTADMVFGVRELVSYLSRAMTLETGDIIATGTPAGVGFKRDPQVLLSDGDVVEVEVQGLGGTANRLVAPGVGLRVDLAAAGTV